MEAINLDPTVSTPEVHFNPETGILELKGESRPENVREFYSKLLDWMDGYLKECIADNKKNPVKFKCHLEYFNSSSAKFILHLMKKMAEYGNAGIPVEVDWCYAADDDDMKDTGEVMEKMSKVKFNYLIVD